MKKLKIGHWVFFIISTVVVFGLYHFYYNTYSISQNPENVDPNMPIAGFCISVVASILASLIYSLLNDVFFSTKQDEQLDRQDKQIEEYKKTTSSLINTTNVIKSMTTRGVSKICFRSEIEDDFWKSFIINTKDELILSGKTLHRWILTSDNKREFSNNIKEVLRKDFNVTFVIYEEDSLGDEDKIERVQIKGFLENEIFPYLSGLKGKLTIKETTQLPYFYITNRINSVTMPYFSSVSNDENLTIIINAGDRLDNTYYKDYQRFIGNLPENSWLRDYNTNKQVTP